MAWTDTCKMDAVAQVNKRKELTGSLPYPMQKLPPILSWLEAKE